MKKRGTKNELLTTLGSSAHENEIDVWKPETKKIKTEGKGKTYYLNISKESGVAVSPTKTELLWAVSPNSPDES